MIRFLRERQIAILGGILASSWCVHLYLMLIAFKNEDRTGQFYETAVVIGHELFIALLILYSRHRTRRGDGGAHRRR